MKRYFPFGLIVAILILTFIFPSVEFHNSGNPKFNTGDIAWQSPLGLVEGLPEGKENLGSSGSAGPLATGGGLVFIGATSDHRFRAFDSKTGKELWAAKLSKTANANPMTYEGKNGKQYVAIMATDSLVVFALP